MAIIKNKARCKKCNDIIESTHTHDFKYCKCESMYVDGGKDYIRRGYTDGTTFEEAVEELSEFAPD